MRLSILLALLASCGGSHSAGVGQAEAHVMQDPTSPESWVALGNAYHKAKRTQEAADAYARALSIDPDNEAARQALGENGGAALTQLEREALANPNDDELWGDVGDEYSMRGDRERALHFYLYAMRLDPSDSEWQRKVAEHGGIDQVRDLLSVNDQDDESLGDMGDMMRAAGEEASACEFYAQANAIDPADSEWIEALRPCPQEPVAGYGVDTGDVGYGTIGGVIGGGGTSIGVGAPSLVERGRQALDAGARDQARTYFERALLESPTDSEALAGLMIVSGRTEIQVLERLVEQITDNDEIFGDLGDAYLAQGRLPEALGAYESAARLDPDDAEWTGKLEMLRAGTQEMQ